MRVPFLLPLVAALASGAAWAQVDAGPDADAGSADAGDAGPQCAPACTGDQLSFCDQGDVVDGGLDCSAGSTQVEGAARCGLISAAWGFDCILGEGAACDPGYAFGLSRCDRDASLFCVDGVCTAGTAPPAPVNETPSPGTNTVATTSTTSAGLFSCLGCGGSGTSGAALFGALLLSLRQLRRVRRRQAG